MTRKEARAMGLVRYQGGPCSRGHTGPRYARTGNCCECERLRLNERHAELRGYRSKPFSLLGTM